MLRKSILVVAIVLALCAGLAGGYFIWSYPKATPIAEDSFILSTHVTEHMSQLEYEEYQAWVEKGAPQSYEDYTDWAWNQSLPFNRFGWYVNRFYLQENETVEVVMKSNQPLGVIEVNDLPPSGGSVITIVVGISGDIENLFSAIVKRVDGGWELRFTFKAERLGYYFLEVVNELPDQVSCRYTVTLKS